MPTARFWPRQKPCTASWCSRTYRRSRPPSLRRSASSTVISPRSATSLPPTTGPMRWPLSRCRRCCTDWMSSLPHPAAASDGAESQPDASSLIPLPALPGLAEMAGPTANLVLILNQLGARRENPILASMYRHLAYWPAYLALSWALIAPLDADGSLDRAIAGVLETARSRATSVAARLYSPPVDATTRASIRSAVEPFAGDVIARMVVICAVLRAATGP